MRKLEKISARTIVLGIGIGLFVVAFIAVRIAADCDHCVSREYYYSFGALFGVYCIFLAIISGVRYFRIERVAFNLENQPVTGTDAAVSGGSFAGSGTIVASKLLNSPHGQKSCVYYRVREEVERGIRRKRWEIVRDEVKFVPFEIEDHRGKIAVDLTNIDHDDIGSLPKSAVNAEYINHHYSQVQCVKVFDKMEYETREKLLGGLFMTTEKRQKTEYVLPNGHAVNVFGFAHSEEGQVVLREGRDFPLIITDHPHKLFLDQFQQGRVLLYLCPLLILGGSLLVLQYLYVLGWVLDVIYISVALSSVVACGFFIGMFVFNRMVLEFQRTANAKGNLEGELRRRNDLITNLLAVVREYGEIEKSVLTRITSKRLRIGMTDDQSEADFVFGDIGAILAENYPTLKADALYGELLHHLSDTESRIMHARDFHNENVLSYNQYIEMFPHNILAKIVGFKKKQYFAITDQDQVGVPSINM